MPPPLAPPLKKERVRENVVCPIQKANSQESALSRDLNPL